MALTVQFIIPKKRGHLSSGHDRENTYLLSGHNPVRFNGLNVFVGLEGRHSIVVEGDAAQRCRGLAPYGTTR